jgi:hypothetical protein
LKRVKQDRNPYKPPEYWGSEEGLDRWMETKNSPPETDWGTFIVILIFLTIFFFHRPLFDFFFAIFKQLLYN